MESLRIIDGNGVETIAGLSLTKSILKLWLIALPVSGEIKCIK